MTSGRLPDGDRWWNRGSRKRGYLRAPKTTRQPPFPFRSTAARMIVNPCREQQIAMARLRLRLAAL